MLPAISRALAAFAPVTAQRNINLGILSRVRLPSAPLDEQKEIVDRIEQTFFWSDRLAIEATSARNMINNLDQAVLAKAFRGELVPQDPNNEPASVLLERIHAERAAARPSRERRSRRAGKRQSVAK
jgi:type I restriction enzyme S subunit